MAFEDDMIFRLRIEEPVPKYSIKVENFGLIGEITAWRTDCDDPYCSYEPEGKALELGWTINSMNAIVRLLELLQSGWKAELSQWYTFVDGKPVEAASCTEPVNQLERTDNGIRE